MSSQARSEHAGSQETITLVGAGLVGSLLSIYLARRGFDVEILERRPDMRREKISAGRSINLAVSVRGFHALEQVGLKEEVLQHAIPMHGRMIHSPKGELAFQSYGKDDSQAIYSVSRGTLNQLLMTEAEKTGRVRIQFGAKVTQVDLARKQLEIVDAHEGACGARAVRSYSRLIGTDGSASAVRDALMRTFAGAGAGASAQHTAEELDYGYKELTIPAGPGGAFQLEKHALHIWPRGSFMLIALPNVDGSFTCTLFLPHEGPHAGEASFEKLKEPAQVRAFFEKHFADAVALMPDLVETFFQNPTGHMVTVKCQPWHHEGSVALVGDAAHAIVPFFGQGMNCGFEDCSVLDSLLESQFGGRGSWERVFSEFERLRKPNADAIADMAVENFIEMRDKVGDARFLLMKEVEKILLKEFPGEFASRYALVTFSRTPYRAALEVGAIAEGILNELCRDLRAPQDVNLTAAGVLIREKLVPFLKKGETTWT